jgi:hypothetical protein
MGKNKRGTAGLDAIIVEWLKMFAICQSGPGEYRTNHVYTGKEPNYGMV